MTKRLFLLAAFLFLFPVVSEAQISFREGKKVWKNYSATQYDTALNAAVLSFPDQFRVSKNLGVDLGPVSIRLDDFLPGSHPHLDYWVRIIALPNIQLDNQVLLKIVIEHIWDLEKNDLYNHKEKSRQSLQNFVGDEAVTFINKLHLIRGTDAHEIQEIAGEVIFNLPLEVTWVTFEASDLKKEKNIPATPSKISLNNLRFNGESSWVEIHYQGKEESYLTSLAYDKMGKQLKKKGFAKNSLSDGWLYAYAFAGEVEKIQTLFSSHVVERKYPFKINP